MDEFDEIVAESIWHKCPGCGDETWSEDLCCCCKGEHFDEAGNIVYT